MGRQRPKKGNGNLWTRRDVLKAMGGAAGAAGLLTLDNVRTVLGSKPARRVMVLGIDGMDPELAEFFMAQGKMPNARKLAEMGGFCPLGTSMPPQSPVAWANFITGMNPGGHGIFDFIHRDPGTFAPYLSTSRTYPAKREIALGKWVIPISPGEIKLMRGGKAFWNILAEHGLESTVFRIPSNFPPEASEARTLSGMGTPDILGTYGTFSYYTDDPPENAEDMGGGKVFPVRVRGNTFVSHLAGPYNAYRKDREEAKVRFTVWIDSHNPVAKVEIQGREIVLKQGEWSEWVVVKFEMIPHVQEVSGICRIYLKETHPNFKMYVSPINIDPADPAMPISTPPDYAEELVDALGYFYTQGMPEDTKALSNDILSDREYLDQATFVLDERLKFYDYELDRFRNGFFFFYFSSLDLNSHMFWRTRDPHHPLYSPELRKEFGWFIPFLYQKMDDVIGKAMKRLDGRTTLMVMSDHGFVSFRRGFNLNTWLLNNGYAALDDPLSQEETTFFDNVDWTKTMAYGLGINSVYLNVAGREKQGIVSPGEEAERLADELSERLCRVKDPMTGEKAISHAYRPKQLYSGEFAKKAPDLIVGYNRHYRSSWDTILGTYPLEEFVDNDDKWSGDHCMDDIFLPGVFMCSKKFSARKPALYDLAPSILSEFGIDKPKKMVGKSVFSAG